MEHAKHNFDSATARLASAMQLFKEADPTERESPAAREHLGVGDALATAANTGPWCPSYDDAEPGQFVLISFTARRFGSSGQDKKWEMAKVIRVAKTRITVDYRDIDGPCAYRRAGDLAGHGFNDTPGKLHPFTTGAYRQSVDSWRSRSWGILRRLLAAQAAELGNRIDWCHLGGDDSVEVALGAARRIKTLLAEANTTLDRTTAWPGPTETPVP